MSNKHKTVNASPASYEILTKIKEDAESTLGITVSLSEAIQLSGAAYFELKGLKQRAKDKQAPNKENFDIVNKN